jgi:hypothetical protein
MWCNDTWVAARWSCRACEARITGADTVTRWHGVEGGSGGDTVRGRRSGAGVRAVVRVRAGGGVTARRQCWWCTGAAGRAVEGGGGARAAV